MIPVAFWVIGAKLSFCARVRIIVRTDRENRAEMLVPSSAAIFLACRIISGSALKVSFDIGIVYLQYVLILYIITYWRSLQARRKSFWQIKIREKSVESVANAFKKALPRIPLIFHGLAGGYPNARGLQLTDDASSKSLRG
jgi:hypothetical protein